MSLVAVIGNASTTTALAIASSWPHGEEALLAELDPSGGDLAAWLDLSQEPGIASAVSAAPNGSWPSITEHIQTQAGGPRLLVAPIRALEASAAVREASARLVPTLSALDEPDEGLTGFNGVSNLRPSARQSHDMHSFPLEILRCRCGVAGEPSSTMAARCRRRTTQRRFRDGTAPSGRPCWLRCATAEFAPRRL